MHVRIYGGITFKRYIPRQIFKGLSFKKVSVNDLEDVRRKQNSHKRTQAFKESFEIDLFNIKNFIMKFGIIIRFKAISSISSYYSKPFN